MLIGSKGVGILAIVMPIPMMITVWLLTWAVTRDEHYSSRHTWTLTASLALSAYAVWRIGRALNKTLGRDLIDPDCKHAYFGIPMQYFAFLHVVLAVFSLFLKN